MKGFMKKGAVIVVAGMLLTGCGEEVTTLTESEEAVVVNYSAGTLAKFNKRQQDGMTVVAPREEEVSEEETEEPVVPEEEDSKEQEKPDEQESTTEADKPEKTEEVDLTQAIGVPGVEVKYNGYEVRDVYEESDYFSMAATEGKTYLVMKYTLTNTGSEEAVCDILAKKPIFTVSLNGNTAHKNEVTLLPNDLSTYAGSLAPGAAAEAVLIFEVPLDETADITTVQMGSQINGVSRNIAM